ncbi:MAG TPA: helix-turn-helix transcriptional regulator [Dehalococcoidia bacterium]|nr:helix-turn-helix transcriptional regulator [Dehalococcoidia bacterium]
MTWFERLALARRRLGMTQAELADRAHVSLPTVKAYETGRRRPSHPYLIAVLDALHVDRHDRNQILTLAGYASDAFDLGPWRLPGFMLAPGEAIAEVDALPWPAFLANETMTVLHANTIAQRLWGVDLDSEFQDPIDRNLLSVASNPRFARRCLNYRDVVPVFVSIWKGHHRGAEALESPNPLFGAILQRFLAGEPEFVTPFVEAWQNVEPRTPKIRWRYPVVWDAGDGSVIRFECVVNPASEPDGLAFNDWIPVDAASAAVCERLRAGA